MAIKYVQRPFAVTTTNGSSATLTEETGTTADKRIVTLKSVTDDGAGNLGGGLGTVVYASKAVNLRVVSFDRSTKSYKSDYEKADSFEQAVGDGSGSSSGDAMKGGSYGTAAVGEEVFAGSSVVTRYRTGAGSPRTKVQTFKPPAVFIDLCPLTSDRIVPGSVRFRWMKTVYEDFDGIIWRDRTDTSPGIASGVLDLDAGGVQMTDYVVDAAGDPTDFQLLNLWTQAADWSTGSVFGQTQASPLQPGPGGWSMTVMDTKGTMLTASVDVDGNIVGPHMLGKVDAEFGEYQLMTGDYVLDSSLTVADKLEWWYSAADVGAVMPGRIWRPWPVLPNSMRLTYVARQYMPVDEAVTRIDATTLPPDGRVPMFWPGLYLAISHPLTTAPATYSNGDPINMGRTRLSLAYLRGADGSLITTGYTQDLDAGTVQVLDTTGWEQPVTVEHWLSRVVRVSGARIDGTVQLSREMGHEFPAGSIVSGLLIPGDVRARVQRVLNQATWDGITYADVVVGNESTTKYNATDFPITVTNFGALTERFALRFRSNGIDFDCYGQGVGFVAAGNKNTDFAPINPRFGKPYFTMLAGGFGAANWPAGATIFVHTVGAMPAVAFVRAVQPSEVPSSLSYSFEAQARYDVDRPPGP